MAGCPCIKNCCCEMSDVNCSESQTQKHPELNKNIFLSINEFSQTHRIFQNVEVYPGLGKL